MRRSDKVLTLALCLSLVVHAMVYWVALRERIDDLMAQLFRPATVEKAEVGLVAKADELPPGYIVQETVKTVLPWDPPKVFPPKIEDQQDKDDWGEKDKTGFALSTTPGKESLKARTAEDDQAFTSRDPRGPGDFPDDPSISTAPPGENGDGQKAMRDALAGKGTAGEPIIVIGRPGGASTIPPKPVMAQAGAGVLDDANVGMAASGQASSALPAAEQKSPAERATLPAIGEGEVVTVASAQPVNQLPTAESDVIGIKRFGPTITPAVVEALTAPPGLNKVDGISQLLPEIATADRATAPRISAATHSMVMDDRAFEEMALLVGQSDPNIGARVTEALLHMPGLVDVDGTRQDLPQIAPAVVAIAPAIQNALVAMNPPLPPDEELLERIEDKKTEIAAVMVPKGAVGSAASATGGAVGPQTPAADPAADLGFETDPFSKIPNIEYRDGKVEARTGRQVKPLRPHLTEAGRRDLLAQQFPTIVMKVKIDNTGKVTSVDVVKGSGSQAIDMPVYRAMWGWWFEPPKDKDGRALPDTQLVSIRWG